MMAKLLEVLQNSGSDKNGSFPGFDLEAFRLKAAKTLRTAFRSMDDKSKKEFLAWIAAVRTIRQSDQSYREKEKQLAALPNTETSFRTLKAVLDAAVGAAPEQDQKIIKGSLTGIGLATSMMNWKLPPMAMFLVGQALPKFMLTPQFEIVATFLEQELQKLMKELDQPPTQK